MSLARSPRDLAGLLQRHGAVAAILFLVCVLNPSAAPAKPNETFDARGLVARYTFEEGTGSTLRDHSGKGHHGRIRGATWVDTPMGGALQFNGRDALTDLGRPRGLNLDGDLTIEVWLRASLATVKRGTQPLIFGMNAGPTKTRNYNLRIDHKQRLRFEWGDGEAGSFVSTSAGFLDGTWRYVAVVVDSGSGVHVFVDGSLVHTQRASMPIVARPPQNVTIGGWGPGFFQGEIAELRLFNRALSTGEIRKHAGRAPDSIKAALRLHPSHDVRGKRVHCDVFVESGAARNPWLEIRLTDARSGRALASTKRKLGARGKPVSHSWQRVSIPAEIPAEGIVRADARLLDGRGKELARHAVIRELAPRWLTAGAGASNEVLPPWTPCVTRKEKGRVTVDVWGRKHRFGRGPLLESLTSGGAELLAAPIRLQAAAGGRALRWKWNPPKLVDSEAHRVVIRQSAVAGGLRLTLDTQLEYDGLLWTEARLRTRRAIEIDRLALEIPLPADQATLLNVWRDRTAHAGLLKTDFAHAFAPLLWIGNEERGLSFCAESDQFWALADPDRALEVQRVGDETRLRLNFVTRPSRLAPGRPWTYAFGLQGTPVRPIVKSYWDLRVHRMPVYSRELEWPKRTIGDTPALQHYAERGARALIAWEWCDAFSYMLPLGREKSFRALVAAMDARSLKVLPYSIGFLLSDRAPEFDGWSDEFLREPRREFPSLGPVLQDIPQSMYFTCPNGLWKDFAVAMAARCMQEYGAGGVYLDTTTRPFACQNGCHGCGYTAPDGRRVSTYPVRGARELMRRLRTAVKACDADGIVDVHPFDCLNVPALAYADGMWIGEHLRRVPHKIDALPLDRFRTEILGRNLGIPSDLLYYRLADYEACLALALLHDVPVRSEKDADIDILAQVYRIRDAFGCRESEFAGYWEVGNRIRVSGRDCHASYWKHPKHGVLVVISNLSKETTKLEITFDLAALGIGSAVSAYDERRGKPLPLTGGTLQLALPSQQWTLVRIPRR
ncbi:MAG: DUF6067 family protein [Planctomycetota bacterium]|nr:DUF6067 family protein [Planctomycetota bacterium]